MRQEYLFSRELKESIGLWIDEHGYFEKENLKIELYEYANGLEIIKAMEEGKIDLGYIGNGAHKFCIKGRAAIAIMSHLSNAEAIIGNRSHEVRTVADLRGKRIEM